MGSGRVEEVGEWRCPFCRSFWTEWSDGSLTAQGRGFLSCCDKSSIMDLIPVPGPEIEAGITCIHCGGEVDEELLEDGGVILRCLSCGRPGGSVPRDIGITCLCMGSRMVRTQAGSEGFMLVLSDRCPEHGVGSPFRASLDGLVPFSVG